ncbi:MAG: hypothetical protein Q8N63_06090 [Nanoarchaeota archaeon]|nr:hypothetical protein [Nanoarchaeota archaeon]
MVSEITIHSKGYKSIDYMLESKCQNFANPCKMCYMNSYEFLGKPIKKDFGRILSDLEILTSQGYNIFFITRDILNRKDWKEIVSAGKQTHVLTTGEPLIKNPDIINDLVNLRIKQVIMTYSAASNEQDELNLPKKDHVTEASNLCRMQGLSVMLTMIVYKNNYTKPKEMIQAAVDAKATDIRFVPYVPFFNLSLAMTPDETKKFVESVNNIKKENIFPKDKIYIALEGLFSGYHKGVCDAGAKNHFLIGLDNYIYPCNFLVKPQFVIGRFDGKNVIINNKKQNRAYCRALEMYIGSL